MRLLLLFAFALCAAMPASGGSASNREFEKMKTLVGDWAGKSNVPNVHDATKNLDPRVNYKLIASGSALMETLNFGEVEMVTIYHPLGEHMMLTHYCAARNQPRMKTTSAPPDLHLIHFSFLDATNMMNSDATAMHDLTVFFKDADHFVQEWRQAGKDKEPVILTYTRKKP